MADKYYHNSPYAFSENKVTTHVELEGLEAVLPSIAENNKDRESIKANREAAKEFLKEVTGASDINDATVLVTTVTRGGDAVNVDGSEASMTDKLFAGLGAGVPFASGSAIKEVVQKFLVRFGDKAETAQRLAKKSAEAMGLPHGVSTKQVDKLQKTDLKHRVAEKSEVEKVFEVRKTGTNARHHTVNRLQMKWLINLIRFLYQEQRV